MKQNFTKFIFTALIPLAAYGQTIVSTTPENRKVILEEYTGIKCQYCPDGHRIANQIKDENPDNFFIINIHQGGFAVPSSGQPDFRTPYGNALAAQIVSGSSIGYPIGTISRHLFPSHMQMYGGTGMDRGQWKNAANQLKVLPSYVNVGLQATVNYQTRVMTIKTEVYYTGDSPVGTNKLNIALLQNNTRGPQTGGGQGNNYNHMHRLVDLITGQWGEDITTTTAGSFIEKTYTYTIPADLNGVPIVLGDLELVAFVAEGRQEIISGNGTYPSYTNLPFDNDASIKSVTEIIPQCVGVVSPKIEIKNNGNNPLTSLAITYSVNGGTPQVYNWTGNLGGLQYETVVLPEIAYDQDVNEIQISLPSDQDNANNVGTIQFNRAIESSSSLILTVRTDQYPTETSWKILDAAGNVIQQTSYASNQQNQTFTYNITLPVGCYTFVLIDSYGDGGRAVNLKDHNGVVIYNTSGSYGSGVTVNFSTDGTMGVSDLNSVKAQIYPNPSTGIVNINLENKSTVEVFDTTGRLVYKQSDLIGSSVIDLSGKGKGVFVVKISDGKSVESSKLIIK